ncbi:MAG TPA: 50S ribosomal protein L23 [Candidatus Sulfotelmatobacter sp.]|nr:50S ribosomal protein L23 [Candidatus Sulfotelmatobacter sp.]
MIGAYALLARPIITEKATRLKDEANQYVFRVPRSANKLEIQRAIESLFKVKVMQVRTLNVRGKAKRLGRFEGRTAGWKKAVATLAPGQTIEIAEGT